jgi:hypothetical protein
LSLFRTKSPQQLPGQRALFSDNLILLKAEKEVVMHDDKKAENFLYSQKLFPTGFEIYLKKAFQLVGNLETKTSSSNKKDCESFSCLFQH